MSPLATRAIVFACIFGVALSAMFFKRYLPEHHLSADSKDVVKMGMGTMATLAASENEPGSRRGYAYVGHL